MLDAYHAQALARAACIYISQYTEDVSMCIMAVPARMWGLLEGFARDTRYDYGIGLVNNTVSKD